MSKDTKKKTDKQIFRRWILIMILAFVGGGVGGFFATPVAEWLKNVVEQIQINEEVVAYVVFAGFLLFNLGGIGVTYFFYRKSKNMLSQWDGEDEDKIDEIEKKLDFSIIPISITMVCNQFFFVAAFYVAFNLLKKDAINYALLVLLIIVLFLGASFVFVALQKKVVDLEKQLNPEKKGNFFDKNFSKEWMASCDEAQQLIIYKSSFEAYKAVGSACQILWLLAFVGAVSFNTGLLPVFCVTVIMLVMQIAYIKESIKLERRK